LVIIDEILRKNNLSSIHEAWPNLELYLHGGLNIEPYKESFKAISQKNINYYQNYNATEGFFGLQHNNNDEDMLLMLDYGIYYEFISKENWFKSQPQTLSLDEVDLNQPYEIVVTTNGGLWRYRLEDTIVFTSLNPFKIKVTGRTKQFISSFGEHVIVEEVEEALKKACEVFNETQIIEFTVGPRIKKSKGKSQHEWLIEFKKLPKNLNLFEKEIDLNLQRLNSYYEDLIKDGVLSTLKIKPLKRKSFINFMKSKGKLGGQNKVPRLSNDDNLINEIIKFQ